MENKIILITLMVLIVFTMGCIGEPRDFEETELEVEEGVGVVDTLRIEELRPGLSGFVSLIVRSNLEGAGASNVKISLENVRPFGIIECGETWEDPNEERTCMGQLEMDVGLPIKTRGTARIFPGEELEVFWRLQAPSKEEISDIALKHPLYYNVEYSYSVNFRQNVIFMSQDEMLRRRQAGEEYVITGETGSTAGEIRFSSATRQPIYYAFDYRPGGESERAFDFVLSYSARNRGKGFPISDIILILKHPGVDSVGRGIKPNQDEKIMEAYGWITWEEFERRDCHDGEREISCEKWLEEIFSEDDWENIKENKENLLFKIIERKDFVPEFTVHAPMQITAEEMNNLRNANIPLKLYSFNVHTAYRYYIEGKEYITVHPLRGI